jgi:single-strand DNA-binding protein
MPNFNHTVIIGHLVRDAETRFLPSGASVTECAIAQSEKWTNKKTNLKEEKTLFLDLVIWGPSGERFAEWYQKGRAVMVAGKLEQDSWEDKESGKNRTKIKLNVRDHQACGPSKDGSTASQGSAETSSQPPGNNTLPGMPIPDEDVSF